MSKTDLGWRLVFTIILLLVVGACTSGPNPFYSPLAQPLSPLPKLPEGLRYNPAASTAKERNLSYLPLVQKLGECSLGPIQNQIAVLFSTDPEQRRVNIVCDPKLILAAQYRADDMQARHYFAHTDPDGHTPNYWARKFGCYLPDTYPLEDNQVESIALNYPTAEITWQAWKNSPGHRAHVLGTDLFFAKQVRFGIGYSAGSYGIFYVLVTSPSC